MTVAHRQWRLAGPGLLLGLLVACRPAPPPEPVPPPPPPPATALATPPDATAYGGEYSPSPAAGRIPTYRLRENLSDVANLKQFGALTAAQKRRLGQLGFVAEPSYEPRLETIYLNASEQGRPVFVSADAAMLAFQRWQEDTWRRVQAESLPALVSACTLTMLQRSQEQVETAPAGEVRDAAVRNVAYFGVAAQLLGIPISVDPEAAKLIETESQRVRAGLEAVETCTLLPLQLDYRRFQRAAGEQTRAGDARQALRWYVETSFPLLDERGQPRQDILRQVLLWSHALTLEPGSPLVNWAVLDETLAWFGGRAGGCEPRAIVQTAAEVYGPARELADYKDFDRLAQFAAALQPVAAAHLFPAPALPDEPLLQEFQIGVARPLCSGFQLMAAVGLPRALQLVDQVYRLPAHDAAYAEAMAATAALAGSVAEEAMRADLSWGRLWAIAPLNEPAPEGRPSFCASNAWYDRCLSSTLASWPPWRTPAGVEQPGEAAAWTVPTRPTKPPIGYVEPCPEVFRRLEYLVTATVRGLSQSGLLTPAIETSQQRLAELLSFLETIAAKELGNDSLTAAERARLATVGHELAWLCSGLDSLRTEREDVPRVAYPVTAADGSALETWSGPLLRVLIVVPDGGRFYLAEGALGSYYERLAGPGERLADGAWRTVFTATAPPLLPAWCASFVITPAGQGLPEPTGPVLFDPGA